MDWLLIVIVLLVGGAIWAGVVQARARDTLAGELAQRFPQGHVHVSEHDRSFIVHDPAGERVAIGLATQRGGLLSPEAPYEAHYPLSALRKIEIRRNGTTVATTNRGSQAFGAAVGALAFGGIGAIIGGLSASSTAQDHIRSLSLSITVDDPQRPIHRVTFLDWSHSKKGLKPDSFLVRNAVSALETFAARLENAMHAGQAALVGRDLGRRDGFASAQAAGRQPDTVELIRDLWRLREAGAIDSAEFHAQKARLLNDSAQRSTDVT